MEKPIAAATSSVGDETLRAEKIHFRYRNTVALTDVSMPLYKNKVTALMGPSGCGKSTLLRIFNLMHLLYPDQRVEGEVWFRGANILSGGIDPHLVRTRIGMVFQRPLPFPLSIYDNVAYGLRLYADPPKSELDARVEHALRRAALWTEVKDVLPKSGESLSGGQQQRLCIARALAVQPEILLLDEPCSALDPASTHCIEETIRELVADTTIAIVTHNLAQAQRISDYTGFMYLGRLVEFGTTESVFESPKDEHTRQYVLGLFG